MNKKLFAINLNFDSLGEAYGWPRDFVEDAAFTKGVDRILNLSQKFNIPITFFLVGKDLENKKNFEIIRKFLIIVMLRLLIIHIIIFLILAPEVMRLFMMKFINLMN